MLLARLFTFFRDMKTFHIFLLEILAVFIGITASLFIDDWRQERDDYEKFDLILQEIHFSALVDRQIYRNQLLSQSYALEGTVALAYGDSSQYSDEELLGYFGLAIGAPGQIVPLSGFDRLVTANLAIRFDPVLAELDSLYATMLHRIERVNDFARRIDELLVQLFEYSGVMLDPRIVGSDFDSTDASLERRNDLEKQLLIHFDSNRAKEDTATALRAALQTPELQAVLRGLAILRLDNGRNMHGIESWATSVVAAIREYSPNITLPINAVGIDGTATGIGFSGTDDAASSNSLPMAPTDDDPNVWQLETDLIAGELKFRADDSWDIEWGAPRTRRNIGPSGSREFAGDPATVFPRGIAELAGQNIPIDTGRYRITFNSQSFEYSFEEVD